MGQRLRLKSNYAIPSTWTKEEKAVGLGLKKYGALVADNGNFFSISITPDDRWPASAFSHISSLGITNFEVVRSTGPSEGPRSPGAPVAYAGSDQTFASSAGVNLDGFVSFTGTPPTIQWKLYSGPGSVTFTNPAQTNTSASFSAPGVYTLMLSASDGLHAVAYDAVAITVAPGLLASLTPSGTNLVLHWTGGSPPYVVESSALLPTISWIPVLTTNTQSATIPMSNPGALFRVRSQ
jgi:hypothetical protein